MRSINDPRIVLNVLHNIGRHLKLKKSSVTEGEDTVLLLYKGDFWKKKYFPCIFDFEFSFKFNIVKQQLIPLLRFTNYAFHSQDYLKIPCAARELQSIRLKTLKSIFRYFGLLSHKNNALLDTLSRITADGNYILPVQFALDLQGNNRTLKVYYWCDEKYRLSQKKRHRVLFRLLSLLAPKTKTNRFLKGKNILFFSLDFRGAAVGMKIYLLYRGHTQILNDLRKLNFNRETTSLLKGFLDREQQYFDRDPILCVSVDHGELSAKKVEIFIKKKLRNRAEYARKATHLFLRRFFPLRETGTFLKRFPVKDVYVYSVGGDFVTIYSRFKLWNFNNRSAHGRRLHQT